MEKAPDFHVGHLASAPSYEEAMKCPSISPGQMSSYPHLVQDPVVSPQTAMGMPMATSQPLQQMALSPLPQPQPQPTQQMPSMVQSKCFFPKLWESNGRNIVFCSCTVHFCACKIFFHPIHHMTLALFFVPTKITAINIGGGLPVTCPSCTMPLHTRVGYTSTCSTHCGFLLCCLFG